MGTSSMIRVTSGVTVGVTALTARVLPEGGSAHP
jgi:hypothetical protein